MARKRKGERPDGRIQVTLTDGQTASGKPRRISFYGYTRAEAEAKRDEYVRAREHGLRPDLKDTLLSDWIDTWVQTYSINTEHRSGYIRKLKKDLGQRAVSSITEADLARSLSSYAGKTRNAAAAYRKTMQDVFAKARKNGLIINDPSDDLDLPDTTELGTHRAITDDEAAIILRDAPTDRTAFALALMLLTGMRRGEALALTWDNVDLSTRTIRIRANAVVQSSRTTIVPYTKTPAGIRDIPISKPLADLLNHAQTPHTGYVIKSTHRDGTTSNLAQNSLTIAVSVYNRNHGTHFRCHDMRHTYATYLYEAGVDVKAAQTLLGHKTIQMTLGLYTHLSEQKKTDNNARLNDYLNKHFITPRGQNVVNPQNPDQSTPPLFPVTTE